MYRATNQSYNNKNNNNNKSQAGYYIGQMRPFHVKKNIENNQG